MTSLLYRRRIRHQERLLRECRHMLEEAEVRYLADAGVPNASQDPVANAFYHRLYELNGRLEIEVPYVNKSKEVVAS